MSPRAAHWIGGSLVWLKREFGDEMLRGDVMRPSAVLAATPSVDDRAVLDYLVAMAAARTGIDPSSLQVEVCEDDNLTAADDLPGVHVYKGAAGTYQGHDGSALVSVARSQLRQRGPLVATVAHELAHVRLLREGHVDPRRRDMEQLTDLAVVFFGFGVFAANAAFDFTRETSGWRRSELGYLGEAMLGYGLACYAVMREEHHPEWMSELDTNPRVYMERSLRSIERP